MKNYNIKKLTLASLNLVLIATVLGTTDGAWQPVREPAQEIPYVVPPYVQSKYERAGYQAGITMDAIIMDKLAGGSQDVGATQVEAAAISILLADPEFRAKLNHPKSASQAMQLAAEARQSAKELNDILRNPESFKSPEIITKMNRASLAVDLLEKGLDLALKVGGPKSPLGKTAIGKAAGVIGASGTLVVGGYGMVKGAGFKRGFDALKKSANESIGKSDQAWNDRVKKVKSIQSNLRKDLSLGSENLTTVHNMARNGMLGEKVAEFYQTQVAYPIFGVDPSLGVDHLVATHKDLFALDGVNKIYGYLKEIKRNDKGQIEFSDEQIKEIKDSVELNLKNMEAHLGGQILYLKEMAHEEAQKREQEELIQQKMDRYEQKTRANFAVINILTSFWGLSDPRAANQFKTVATGVFQTNQAVSTFMNALKSPHLSKFNAKVILTGDLVGIAFNIVGAFMNQGPTADQLILEGIDRLGTQISGLSIQMNEMNVQMHGRFTRVDMQLSAIQKDLSLLVRDFRSEISKVQESIREVDLKVDSIIEKIESLNYRFNEIDKNLFDGFSTIRNDLASLSLMDCYGLLREAPNTTTLNTKQEVNKCLGQIKDGYMKNFGSVAGKEAEALDSLDQRSLALKLRSNPSDLNNFIPKILQYARLPFFSDGFQEGTNKTYWKTKGDLETQSKNFASMYHIGVNQLDIATEFKNASDLINEPRWLAAAEIAAEVIEKNAIIAPAVDLAPIASLIEGGVRISDAYKELTRPVVQNDETLIAKKKLWLNLVKFARNSYKDYLAELRNFGSQYSKKNELQAVKTSRSANGQGEGPNLYPRTLGFCGDSDYQVMVPNFEGDGPGYRSTDANEVQMTMPFNPEWNAFIPSEVRHAVAMKFATIDICVGNFGWKKVSPQANQFGFPSDLVISEGATLDGVHFQQTKPLTDVDVDGQFLIPNGLDGKRLVPRAPFAFGDYFYLKTKIIGGKRPDFIFATRTTQGRFFTHLTVKVTYTPESPEQKSITRRYQVEITDPQVRPLLKSKVPMKLEYFPNDPEVNGGYGVQAYQAINLRGTQAVQVVEPLYSTQSFFETFAGTKAWEGSKIQDAQMEQELKVKMESEFRRHAQKLAGEMKVQVLAGNDSLGLAFARVDFSRNLLRYLVMAGMGQSIARDEYAQTLFDQNENGFPSAGDFIPHVLSDEKLKTYDDRRLKFLDHLLDPSSIQEAYLIPEVQAKFTTLEDFIERYFADVGTQRGEVPTIIEKKLNRLVDIVAEINFLKNRYSEIDGTLSKIQEEIGKKRVKMQSR